MVSGHRGRQKAIAKQIGEYLVCAELGRRGLIATPFSGNVPTFDVLCADEFCRTVPIQVKSSTGDTWPSSARLWMDLELDAATGVQKYHGPRKIENPDLIYVCVAIGDLATRRDRFFVLTQGDLQKACIADYTRWIERHGWKRPRKAESFDLRYRIPVIEKFEDKWDLIRTQLEAAAPGLALPSAGDQD